MRYIASAAAVALFMPGAVSASTLGLPSFTTAPSTIMITNEFFGGLPTPYYELSVSSTIATAQGAPELVGKSLSLTFFSEGAGGQSTPYAFRIDGHSLLVEPLVGFSFLIGPDYTELVPGTWVYDPPFSGFGPRTATFPEIEIAFALNDPLPMRTEYLYCFVTRPDCVFREEAGLTRIDGEDVTSHEDNPFVYPEGKIENGTITFHTVGGRSAVIPLPASLPLLLAGLGGLLSLRRMARSSPA